MSKKYMTKRAKEIFEETWEMLQEMGVVREVDRRLIEGYAVEMATFEEASAMVIEKGPTTFAQSGFEIQSSWYNIRSSSLKQAVSIAKLYGFTPGGRKSVGIDDKKKIQTKFASLTSKPKIA